MTRESRIAFTILAAVLMTLTSAVCIGFGVHTINKGEAADSNGAPPESGYVCVGFGALLILASVAAVVVTVRRGRNSSKRDEPADLVEFIDEDILWWRGQLVRRLEIQKGVIVLRPETVTFVPVAKSVNAGATLAGIFGEAITGIQSLDLDVFKSEPEVERIVSELWSARRDDFDSQLGILSQAHGGKSWPRAEVLVSCSGPRGPRRAVTFTVGKHQFHGCVSSASNLDRLLTGWKRGAPSLVPLMMLLGIVSAVPTIAAALCYYGYRTGEMPAAAPITWGIFAAICWGTMLFVILLSRLRS